MRVKVYKLLLLFLAPLLVAMGSSSLSYKALKGIEFHSDGGIRTAINYGEKSFEIIFNSWFQNSRLYGTKDLEGEIQFATWHVFHFGSSLNFPLQECRNNKYLDFYSVDYSVLNDANRFSDWKRVAPGISKIKALYDPRPEQLGISSIILTKQDSMPIIIGHELSHYWFDRFCWERSWKGSTEDFAQKFEIYYKQKRE